MAAESRAFHLGDVLSVTTGKLLSPDHIGGVYEILDFMLDTKHFTHQLPRAAEDAKPFLLAQHPWLAEIEAPEFHGEQDAMEWLAGQVEHYGPFVSVEQVPEPVEHHPIQELLDMGVRPDRIIGVVVEDEDDD